MPLSLDNSKLVAPRGRCVTAPCVLCSRTRGEGTSLKGSDADEKRIPLVSEVIPASGYINVFILLFLILVCCSSMKADLFEMLLLETP